MRVLQLQSAGIPQAMSEPRLSDLAHAPLQPRSHPLRSLLQPPVRPSLCLRLDGVQLMEVICRRSLYHRGLHHHGRAVQTTSGLTTSLMSAQYSTCSHSQDPNTPPFSVPLVPWLPASSVLINILLTTKLSWQTWIRFSVWMGAGFLVYGAHGWRNSSEEYKMKGLKPPENDNNSESKGSLKMTKYDQDRNSNYFDDFN